MTDDLQASYSHCARVARRAASSFYYSFYLLPRPQRRAMHALYAYLRKTDDLADQLMADEITNGDSEVPARRAALAAWRISVQRALAGESAPGTDRDKPILPALVDTVKQYEIPTQYLFDVIDGVEMDIEPHGFETFADLEQYCYRVASVVGLSCIRIWGFEGDGQALRPARQCGLAFQLTNILRDVRDDAVRGRIYLPREDMTRFQCSAEDLSQPMCGANVRRLMQFEMERAASLYEQAAELHCHLSPHGRRIFGAMLATYRQLLREIQHRQGDVFSRPVRVPRWRRLQIVARSALRLADRKNGTADGRE